PMLPPIGVHDPQRRFPFICKPVHLLARVDDVRAVGRNLCIGDAFELEVVVSGEAVRRRGLLRPNRDCAGAEECAWEDRFGLLNIPCSSFVALQYTPTGGLEAGGQPPGWGALGAGTPPPRRWNRFETRNDRPAGRPRTWRSAPQRYYWDV